MESLQVFCDGSGDIGGSSGVVGREQRMKKSLIKLVLLGSLSSVMLTACGSGAPSGASQNPPPFSGVRVGKPYSIAGKWYKPEENPSYDETGEASWYGPGFHGKQTANGEIFNQYDLTAAHPTLPLPSFVEVTNLRNGRNLVVRVNDRGPFHGGRILDLSKAAAEKLGVIATGVAPVRVRFLDEETKIYIASNGTILPADQPQAFAAKSGDATGGKATGDNAASIVSAAAEDSANNPNNNTLSPQQVATATDLMARENVELPPEKDAHYYKIHPEILESRDFQSVPVEVANNHGDVVDSAPILSVQTSNGFPSLIKPAMADDAPPYPSALKRKNEERLLQKLEPKKPQKVADSSHEVDKYAEEMKEAGKNDSPKTASAKKSPSAPVVAAASATNPTWAVQVASFSERVNAENLAQKLLVLAQPELQPVLIDGNQWYRVYLHPIKGQNQQDLLADLQKIGLHDARIVN
jgi:rare lipoprotein A